MPIAELRTASDELRATSFERRATRFGPQASGFSDYCLDLIVAFACYLFSSPFRFNFSIYALLAFPVVHLALSS